jgi:RNA polymerase sigma-70 factor, ECF subfamily
MSLEALYAEHRQFLWSLCYRMTGSAADAEDVVQDTFVRAIERPPNSLDQPLRPWLVQVALNLSRDLLRRRKHRDYVGPWLPSPVVTSGAAGARGHSVRSSARASEDPPSFEPVIDGVHSLEGRYDLLESVSFAFLVALEALSPIQRAVLLLRDVFDYSVKETAHAVDRSEANVKTIHHRARAAMAAYDRARQIPTAPRQSATRDALTRFLDCLQRNDVAGVEALLADDVKTTTDGGGEFRAALRVVSGRANVSRFYLAIAQIGKGAHIEFPMMNGLPSVLVNFDVVPPGVASRFVLQAELDAEGKIGHLYVISATSKLSAVG